MVREFEERQARLNQEQQSNVCQICQEPLFTEDGGEVFALGVCNDIYHAECIKPWVSTCIENQ